METIALYLIVGFIVFVVALSIARYMFNISDLVNYQIMQYKMLRPHKLGVQEDKILEIDSPESYRRKKKKQAIKD